MARMRREHATHFVNLADVKTWKSAGLRTRVSTAKYSSLCAKNYEDRCKNAPLQPPCRGAKLEGLIGSTCYLTSSIGIFETVQRSLGLATSNCTIEMASFGQRTMHRPQRIHFSSSIIISAPPRQVSRSEERRVGKEWRSRWSPY